MGNAREREVETSGRPGPTDDATDDADDSAGTADDATSAFDSADHEAVNAARTLNAPGYTDGTTPPDRALQQFSSEGLAARAAATVVDEPRRVETITVATPIARPRKRNRPEPRACRGRLGTIVVQCPACQRSVTSTDPTPTSRSMRELP